MRDLRASDIDRFLELVAEGNGTKKQARSAATQAKHLRVLGACLRAAVRRGYAASNPIDALDGSQRPAPAKVDPAYFTDAELPRLWIALADWPAVYAALCKAAVTTGCRQGELLALGWQDVRFLDRELLIQRTFVQGVDVNGEPIGLTDPKSKKGRTVDLTPGAVAVLEAWYTASGSPGGDTLVFPSPTTGSHLIAATITRGVLYEAMTVASIAREGEHARKRDFHSFRHTFARIALQNGSRIDWVQRQLGHSSITLTVDRYGRWERAAEKAEADKLEGVFPV